MENRYAFASAGFMWLNLITLAADSFCRLCVREVCDRVERNYGAGRMRPELWRRAEEVFHAALEQSPKARRPYLDGACGGDSELRRQVGHIARTPGRTAEGAGLGKVPLTVIQVQEFAVRRIIADNDVQTAIAVEIR